MNPKYGTLGCKIKITKNFKGAIVIWSNNIRHGFDRVQNDVLLNKTIGIILNLVGT